MVGTRIGIRDFRQDKTYRNVFRGHITGVCHDGEFGKTFYIRHIVSGDSFQEIFERMMVG